MIIAFLLLVGFQSYWHLAKSDWLLAQPTNRRLARAERSTPRGAIYDRADTRLAWSATGERHYADAIATAAVLGYLDPRYGRSGVEGEWDLELAGLSRRFDARELQRVLREEKPRGRDLVLTLDLPLQQAALRALGERRGAVAVLDPATGGILALATSPTFNAATLGDDYDTLVKRDDGPLRNRAVQDFYPPGSTMKVLTAAAALMHGVDPDTRYTCVGQTRKYGVNITDYHKTAHGRIAMAEALTKSCNFYFASTAAEMSQSDFAETAGAFGFGRAWWDELPDTRMLPLSIVTSRLAKPGDSVSQGERAHMGFGQSTVVTTPLQMAMVSAAVANGGTLMAPYLVAGIGHHGEKMEHFRPKAIGFPMNRDVAEQVATMMRSVVTRGTGSGANVRGLTVYGKTGTAQATGGEDHAWFIGFAEREREGKTERIAFAVVLERGGTGGRVAVPVARQVLEAWKE